MTKRIIKNTTSLWLFLLVTVVVLVVAIAIPASASANSTEVDVSNFVELRTAIEKTSATQINLTRNIALPWGGINVNPNRSHLTVNGNGFTLTQAPKHHAHHVHHAPNFSADIRLLNSGSITGITFQNIEIVGSNGLGFVGVAGAAAFRNVTLTFDNVTYRGPRLVNAVGSNVVLRNSEFNIVCTWQGGELVNASTIALAGDVNIFNIAKSNNYVLRVTGPGGVGGAFVVEEDANVNVVSGTMKTMRTTTSGFIAISNKNATITFADNSTFNYLGGSTFQAYNPVKLVYIGSSAEVNIKTVGNLTPTIGSLGSSGLLHIRGKMVVQENAIVNVIATKNVQSEAPIILFCVKSALEINNPELFFVYNSARNGWMTGLAVGTVGQKALRISYNNIESLEYWKLNFKPHTHLHFPTFDWRNADESSFSAFLNFNNPGVFNVGTRDYTGKTPFNAMTATLNNINVIRIRGGTPPIVHTINFDVTGGAPEIDTVYVINGRTIPEPPHAPERAQFVFAGWYTSPEGSDGERWDFDTPVTIYDVVDFDPESGEGGTLTLYARWTPTNPRTITYFPGIRGVGFGPIEIEPATHISTVPFGSYYTVRTHNAANIEPYMGYYEEFGVIFVFVNWNGEEGGTGTTYFPGQVIFVDDHLELHAQWEMVIVQLELFLEAWPYGLAEENDVREDSQIDESIYTEEYAINEESEYSQYSEFNDMDEEIVSEEQYEETCEETYEEAYQEIISLLVESDCNSADVDNVTEE